MIYAAFCAAGLIVGLASGLAIKAWMASAKIADLTDRLERFEIDSSSVSDDVRLLHLTNLEQISRHGVRS